MTVLTRAVSFPYPCYTEKAQFTNLSACDRKTLQNITPKLVQSQHHKCSNAQISINKNRVDLSPIAHSHHRSPGIKQDLGSLFARYCYSEGQMLKGATCPVITTRTNTLDDEIAKLTTNQDKPAQKKKFGVGPKNRNPAG